MIKKIILGLTAFLFSSGVTLAMPVEVQPALLGAGDKMAEKDLAVSKTVYPTDVWAGGPEKKAMDRCLATGRSEDNCKKILKGKKIKAIKAEKVEAVKLKKAEMQAQKKEFVKKVAGEKKQIKAKIQGVKEGAVIGAGELQMKFREEMSRANTEKERAEIRKKFADKKNELKKKIVDRKGDLKANQDRIKKYLEKRLKNLIRKYEAYKKRAHSVNERIDRKIEELKKKGYDTKKLEALQAKGKRLLNKVDDELKSAKREVEKLLEGDITRERVREAVKKIKENLGNVKRAMKAYFQEVRKVVKEIKDLMRENRDPELLESAVPKTKEVQKVI